MLACSRALAGDRPPPPGLPLAQWWSVKLDAPVTSGAGPVSDGPRVYVALASGHLTARAAGNGDELWRQNRNVTLPMATDGERLIVASGDAVEALDGATGKTVWTFPRTTPLAPLLARSGWVIATTETHVIAIRAATGEEAWRHAAAGMKITPAIDGDRVYAGAEDGLVLALNLTDGSVAWQEFLPGGVTAIAVHGGRVYAGGGDKQLYCLDARKGDTRWGFPLGAFALGRMAADDERVYVAAVNNVVRALDRQSGNQRWQRGLRQRPVFGVMAAGHVIFVPGTTSDVQMLYDYDGQVSGALNLPADAPPNRVPSITETPAGAIVYAVTGDVTGDWHLTKYAPAGEARLIPLADLDTMPGALYLTDPALQPIGNVLSTMLLGDPLLRPVSDVGWPVVLEDPPLLPLTALPGLQLRPLSPVLPVRREGPGPGG